MSRDNVPRAACIFEKLATPKHTVCFHLSPTMSGKPKPKFQLSCLGCHAELLSGLVNFQGNVFRSGGESSCSSRQRWYATCTSTTWTPALINSGGDPVTTPLVSLKGVGASDRELLSANWYVGCPSRRVRSRGLASSVPANATTRGVGKGGRLRWQVVADGVWRWPTGRYIAGDKHGGHIPQLAARVSTTTL